MFSVHDKQQLTGVKSILRRNWISKPARRIHGMERAAQLIRCSAIIKGACMNWYLQVWKSFGDFAGRSRREEYWMFFLFNAIVQLALFVLIYAFSAVNIQPLSVISILLTAAYYLAVFVPWLAVSVRRLHDTDRSGWWMLTLPIIAILLYFYILDGTPGENRYGPNPKGA